MSLSRLNINLSGNSRGYVHLEAVKGVYAAATFLVEFWARLQLEGLKDNEHVILSGIRGDLDLVHPEGGVLHLAELRPRLGQSLVETQVDCERQIILVASLGSRGFEAIEGAGFSDGPRFRVALEAAAEWACGVTLFHASEELKVSQQDWSRVLQESRYAESIIVEVVAPTTRGDSGTPRAFEHLQEAMRARDRRDYRGAIARCRDVLECLPVLAGKSLGKFGKSQVATQGRNRSKEERLQELRNALIDLCHAAHHADDVAEGIGWNRNDALVAIATTSTLLRHFGDP